MWVTCLSVSVLVSYISVYTAAADYANSPDPPTGDDLLITLSQRSVCFGIMANTDNILEADQSYTIDLTSTNADIDPSAASITVTITDTNSELIS